VCEAVGRHGPAELDRRERTRRPTPRTTSATS
jgi:hypothetical protein